MRQARNALLPLLFHLDGMEILRKKTGASGVNRFLFFFLSAFAYI